MTRYLFAAALLLASCTASKQEAAFDAHADRVNDSTARANWHAPAALLPLRKVKGNYTVVYQVAGPGATVTGSADNNLKAGQRQGSQASGPGSTASNESKRTASGMPWYVYTLAGVALIAAWEWLIHQLLPEWRRVTKRLQNGA